MSARSYLRHDQHAETMRLASRLSRRVREKSYISSFEQVVEYQPGVWKSARVDALLGLDAASVRLTSLADRVDMDVVHAAICLSDGVLLVQKGVDRVRNGVVEDSNSLICEEASSLGVRR